MRLSKYKDNAEVCNLRSSYVTPVSGDAGRIAFWCQQAQIASLEMS